MEKENNARLQRKIQYIFNREKKHNIKKMHHLNQSSNSKDEVFTEKFFFPRVAVEKFQSNKFIKYGIFNTNTELYMPLEESHINLCIKYGISTYSRTLRIFTKKKALKKLLKSKNKPEHFDTIVTNLNAEISNIYKSGNTINLNLIK